MLFRSKEVKINDKYALATIMGNIKQESRFYTDICEGGARVPYDRCHRGGFGLIQWTTAKRYNGLGNFCTKYNCNPNTIIGQLRYMVNEEEFQNVLPSFKTPGKSIESHLSISTSFFNSFHHTIFLLPFLQTHKRESISHPNIKNCL